MIGGHILGVLASSTESRQVEDPPGGCLEERRHGGEETLSVSLYRWKTERTCFGGTWFICFFLL